MGTKYLVDLVILWVQVLKRRLQALLEIILYKPQHSLSFERSVDVTGN